jgi:hypothetical protein
VSAAESPATDAPHGPPVGDDEELYRCIAHPHWWDAKERRITSAAFKFPCFSVDVASLAGSPDATLARFRPGTGLVSFSCRAARELGCDIRQEVDPNSPDNAAHAHVYMPAERRKAVARKLADTCTVVREPSFGESGSST